MDEKCDLALLVGVDMQADTRDERGQASLLGCSRSLHRGFAKDYNGLMR